MKCFNQPLLVPPPTKRALHLHLFLQHCFPQMCSTCEISQKKTRFNLHTYRANKEDERSNHGYEHTARNHTHAIIFTHTHTLTHAHPQSSGRWPLPLWHPTISEQMFRGWMLSFVLVSNENGCWISQERLGLGVPTSHQAYCILQNQGWSQDPTLQSVARPISLEKTCQFGSK